MDLVLGVDEGHVIGVDIKAPPPYQSADCLGARERSLHNDSLPPLFHAALGRIRRIDELLAGWLVRLASAWHRASVRTKRG